jgi:riboflavin synthase
MFTGIIECLATVRRLAPGGPGRNLELNFPIADFLNDVKTGDSIAINGACLTVVACSQDSCSFQIGPETCERTNLGQLREGDRVNVERSLRLGDRLGGHMVQGHVDAIGHIDQRSRQGEWDVLWFRCPETLTLQMVSKGSIAIDGVSLTLVHVERDRFSVALIPHTLAATTLGFKPVGATVNLETDMIAKHVCKCVEHYRQTTEA